MTKDELINLLDNLTEGQLEYLLHLAKLLFR